MGLGGISVWQLLIVLLIVVMIFGTRRLRGLGTDLGGALKGFRKAINEAEGEASARLGDDSADHAGTETERVRESRDG